MTTIVLPLKAEYFHAIKAGTKVEEFRLRTPYWRKRLAKMRDGDWIVLTLGYPSREDAERRFVLPWAGMREATIVHPHFGPTPVEVFAIRCDFNASEA
jgi:hypothetical protein